MYDKNREIIEGEKFNELLEAYYEQADAVNEIIDIICETSEVNAIHAKLVSAITNFLGYTPHRNNQNIIRRPIIYERAI